MSAAANRTAKAARSTGQVSSNISAVNGSAGSAASQVLASWEQLDTQSGMLRADINGFLEKIRAA